MPATPTITITSAQQGTGVVLKQPVLEVQFDLTADNPCRITVEISLDNGSTWHDAVTHSSYSGASVNPGSGLLVLIDIPTTWSTESLTRANYANTRVRVVATDTTDNGAVSSASTSDAFAIKTTLPVLSSATGPQYVGSAIDSAMPLTLAGHDGDGADDPVYLRSNLSAATLQQSGGLAFAAYADNATFAFPPFALDGSHTIYLKVYDAFYNASETSAVVTWLQRQGPANTLVRIFGSMGHGDYTGVAVAADGTMSVDRTARLFLRADSALAVEFRILSSSSVEDDDLLDTWVELTPASAIREVTLTTNPLNPTPDNKNTDATVYVRVDFRDAAGNTTPTTTTGIRLNTRIYNTTHTPLRPATATYQHIVREVTSGGNEVLLPRSMVLSGSPSRAWTDTFYPTSHGYPTDANGGLDEAAAIAMGGESTSTYDAVMLNGNGQIIYDSEQRPISTDWTADGTKDYGHMLSSTNGSLVYWVIDNTSGGEFQLEFERFDLNPTSYGPPYNNQSPYRGDCLVVYDADTAGALAQTTDVFGNDSWTLNDSSKLTELMAFTGRGSNVVDLTSKQRMNSSPVGAFDTSVIRGREKLVLILYTDAAGSGSGFKLKGGPARDRTWTNWHLDEAAGRLWVHKHSSLGTSDGASDTTQKRMVYDYFDQSVSVDNETGTVTFDAAPSGVVTSDYTHYTGEDPGTNTYLASWDDLVDYVHAPVYVAPSGQSAITASQKLATYEDDGHGQITLDFQWNKDRGYLELDEDANVPPGLRIFADYSHHTYERLTNDGYGDLTFRDAVLVADTTAAYPDFTWVDVKVVNEGDATLEDGKLKFTARGYDTDNNNEVSFVSNPVVDQVLDINRPWDIQKGTRSETYERMAMSIAANYLWARTCSKTEAQAILAEWANKSFGDIESRDRIFGRAVWVLGGASGSAYPDTTPGEKRCSIEASGRFYADLVI